MHILLYFFYAKNLLQLCKNMNVTKMMKLDTNFFLSRRLIFFFINALSQDLFSAVSGDLLENSTQPYTVTWKRGIFITFHISSIIHL